MITPADAQATLSQATAEKHRAGAQGPDPRLLQQARGQATLDLTSWRLAFQNWNAQTQFKYLQKQYTHNFLIFSRRSWKPPKQHMASN